VYIARREAQPAREMRASTGKRLLENEMDVEQVCPEEVCREIVKAQSACQCASVLCLCEGGGCPAIRVQMRVCAYAVDSFASESAFEDVLRAARQQARSMDTPVHVLSSEAGGMA